jgi:hypothetical protein
MKWVAVILGILVALVLLVVVVGAMLPQSHVAVRSAHLHRPPADVWRAITDVSSAATWRKDIVRVELLPPANGHIAWREVAKHGTANYEGEMVRAPAPGVPGRFISRITDKNLPYGGEWIIDVAAATDGSIVTVTEHGEVYNPLFRFVSRYIMGHTATIDGYLTALGKQFGEEVTPVDVASK